MNLFINGSNREKNCFHIISDVKKSTDKIISLSHKDMKYCLGCNACIKSLENYCVLNDYMSQNIYESIKNADKIILASPLYMSHITGLLKNFIDRLNPFYHHDLLRGKKIYLLLTGQGTEEENKDEINDIIKYFSGISEWMHFNFEFLKYFSSGDLQEIDDVRSLRDYDTFINDIKNILDGE